MCELITEAGCGLFPPLRMSKDTAALIFTSFPRLQVHKPTTNDGKPCSGSSCKRWVPVNPETFIHIP